MCLTTLAPHLKKPQLVIIVISIEDINKFKVFSA